ncbi:hypothetical protein MMC13_003440 [Lambiella insularis]|nr:hypothetical protein [Lambiella insularis]
MPRSLRTLLAAVLVTVSITAPTGLDDLFRDPRQWQPEFGSMQLSSLDRRNSKPSLSTPESIPKKATNTQVPIVSPPSNDPFDLSGIQSLAAIGDSYLSGIGAGTKLTGSDASDCGRYDGSYGYQLNQQIGASSTRKFDFLACAGATSSEVLTKQVPALQSNIQAIILSAGGNDVGLSDVLETCIFPIHPFGSCQAVLQETDDKIKNELPGNVTKLINAVKGKLSKDGTIYYPTYAKFFDATSTQCDTVTWAVKTASGNRPFLTQDLRKKMNDLVDATNKVIQKAVMSAGSQVVSVDYDQYFGDLTGRFCEKGVKEPDPKRSLTLFFEWDTVDPKQPTPGTSGNELAFKPDGRANNTSQKAHVPVTGPVKAPTKSENKSKTIQPKIARTVKEPERAVKPSQLKPSQLKPSKIAKPTSTTVLANTQTKPKYTQKSNSTEPKYVKASASTTAGFAKTNKTTSGGNLFANPPRSRSGDKELEAKFLSDEIKRVFHPRLLGHHLIANLIYYKMAAQRAKALNVPIVPEVAQADTTCKAPPPPPPPPPKDKCDGFHRGPCASQGCKGTAGGKCTAGQYEGCACTSTTATACSLCGGTSDGGNPGYCTTGPLLGQPCSPG